MSAPILPRKHAGFCASAPAAAPSQPDIVAAAFPTIASGPEAFQITLCGDNNATVRAEYVGVVKGRGILVTVPEKDKARKLGDSLSGTRKMVQRANQQAEDIVSSGEADLVARRLGGTDVGQPDRQGRC